MTGGVRSTLILPRVVLTEFPARSKQIPLTDCQTPSPKVIRGDTLKTPEMESEQEKLTVTGTSFQPWMLAPIDLEAVMVGCVRSMLIPVSVVVTEFPAKSMQAPVADWLPPSAKVIGADTFSTPERGSEQSKLTVTGTLYQSFAFGAVDRELVTTGLVKSTLISATVVDAELPAL